MLGLGIALGLAGVDLIDVANARDQPHVMRTVFILGAGGREQVAIAAGIDHDFGQNRLATGLAFQHGPADGLLVHDGVDAQAMQEDVDAGLFDHLDHQILNRFGIHGGIDARAAVDDRAVEFVEPAHHFFAEALADLLAASDDVAGND